VTRFALQPRWWVWHALLVAVLVSFGWLGHWQLGDFEDKGHHAPAGTRPVVALDRLDRPGGLLADGAAGRRVHVSGTYDQSRTTVVPDRTEPHGSDRGFLVVTPLHTTSGVLPVVRGWVPTLATPALKPPTGTVAVTGLLQRSEDGPPPGAAVDVGAGRLPYVATVTVLDLWPYPASRLYDGYLALRTEEPAAAAAPEVVAAQPVSAGGVARWRNLAYALQWWLFAGAAVFFWWVVLRRAAREQQGPPGDPPPPDGAGHPSLAAPRRTT
jgi:cytochrome oxidase assembly protein ShyY1